MLSAGGKDGGLSWPLGESFPPISWDDTLKVVTYAVAGGRHRNLVPFPVQVALVLRPSLLLHLEGAAEPTGALPDWRTGDETVFRGCATSLTATPVILCKRHFPFRNLGGEASVALRNPLPGIHFYICGGRP